MEKHAAHAASQGKGKGKEKEPEVEEVQETQVKIDKKGKGRQEFEGLRTDQPKRLNDIVMAPPTFTALPRNAAKLTEGATGTSMSILRCPGS